MTFFKKSALTDTIVSWHAPKMQKSILSKFAATCFALFFAALFTIAHAATLYVKAGITATGTYPTIQGAINAAVSLDVIQVYTGTYRENIDFRGKNLVVENFAGQIPVIEGLRTSSVVLMNGLSGARLEGFTIRSGIGSSWPAPWGSNAIFGGGVLLRNSLNCTLRRLRIESCRATCGGGVSVLSSDNAILDKLDIQNCTAGAGGGISAISSNLFRVSVVNSLIANCTATGQGGAIDWNYSTTGVLEHLTITRCTGGTLNAAAISRANAARFDARNLIIWGNTSPINQLSWLGGTGTTASTMTNSIVEASSNAAFATNNTALTLTSCPDRNPLFRNTTDFHLQNGSPAIDAVVTSTVRDDLEGNCRPINTASDMGCYEMGMPTTNVSICSGASTDLKAPTGSSCSWSTGATTQSITVKAAGTYTVKITNSAGCTYSAAYNVTLLPSPAVVISGNTTICVGTSTTLTASGGGTYKWSNGAITPAITVSTAGTYTVTVTGSTGCTATASVTVVAGTQPFLDIIGSRFVCQGSASSLSSVPIVAGSVYTWKFNGQAITGTTLSIPATLAAGTYSVTQSVVNAQGCSRTNVFDVIVYPKPRINLTNLSVTCNGTNANVTINIATVGGRPAYSYKWSNGATTQNLTVANSSTTTFSVTVTDANGCTDVRKFDCINPCASNTTPVIPNSSIGSTDKPVIEISKPISSEFKLESYPNPAQNKVFVNYSLPTESGLMSPTLIFYDILGRELKNIPLKSETGVLELDLNFATGNYIYLIKDQAGEVFISKKMVISKN